MISTAQLPHMNLRSEFGGLYEIGSCVLKPLHLVTYCFQGAVYPVKHGITPMV